jgi:hypothetical protein
MASGIEVDCSTAQDEFFPENQPVPTMVLTFLGWLIS